MSAATPPPVASPPSGPPRRVADRGPSVHDEVTADYWTTDGPTKVRRTVEVGRAELRGPTTVGGSLRGVRVETRGPLEVVGRLETSGPLTVVGELRAAGEIHCGALTVRGALLAERHVAVAGALVAEGVVRLPSAVAASADLAGEVDLAGRLRADRATLALRNGSRVGFVEGGLVRATAPVPNPVETILGRFGEAAIGRIEAQRVELTGVAVAFVRAPEILLGPAARVSTVEGTIVARHRSSHVGPESRTVPPAGLTR
ncbi:MAG TPA: hypothetical protein VMG36_02260 [Thermoplasmata archaeon]|nr:hypothetical protein [Thermoplasmata archaeon]